MYEFAQRRVSFANLDWWLWGTATLLALFGIAMIYSATHSVVDPIVRGRWSSQIVFLILSMVAFFVGALLDYRLLNFLGLPSFLAFAALLVLVELYGVEQNGAVRWIRVGGTLVQPTEAGKFMLIVIVAWYLSRYYTERKRLPMLILGLGALAGPLFLVYQQPDLGMLITMLFIIGAMVLMSGLAWSHFLVLGAFGLAGLLLLYSSLEDYMVQRLGMFFNPNEAANINAAYNVRQSLISVGNGGWFGQGWMNGSQNQLHFLRVRHTDFIFSVVAEEFGFVGSCLLLGLLGFLLWRLLRTMDNAEDEFGRLLVGGVGALILFQTFVNTGMNLRIMPVTGMTLPFISSGGSSLVSIMFALGLTQSVNVRRTVIGWSS